MEGPSLFLAEEQLVSFKGKRIRVVSGNTKIGKERFLGKKVFDIFSWGKHLVFQFDNCALRVHFLLFGTFSATVNGKSVTGDYTKSKEPRLAFVFATGSIQMYNCSLKIFEERNLKATYDFSLSIMSSLWNGEKAFQRIVENPDEEIADVLLDQTIFAGVDNIIKNEVLSMTKTNPKIKIRELSAEKIKDIIHETRFFSLEFYRLRKQFVLRKNLKIHRKSTCPWCAGKIIREKTGKRQRWSYFCPSCQT